MFMVDRDEIEARRVRIDVPALADGGLTAPADRDGLSTDYLNHYSEVLMLIEMAAFDDGIVDEIVTWAPIGYREYFLKSPLRRAAAALSAYDALPLTSQASFERIVEALDKLTLGAIHAVQPPCHPQNVVLIAEVIGPGIRRLIDRAAAFLNSGGVMPADRGDAEQAQLLTDRLISPA